jgi:hypothetical protein
MHEIADVKLMVGTYGLVVSEDNPLNCRAEPTLEINSAL